MKARIGILPKYLELTPETKRLATEHITNGASKDTEFAHYINTLTNPGIGYRYDGSHLDDSGLKQRRALDSHMSHKPLNIFYHREKCLQAFRHIGLDVRGGIASIDRTRCQTKANHTSFLTDSILVTDAAKARKYVNIGVHVKAISLMHDIPKTLEEAVKHYALFLYLNKNGFRTVKEIENEIENCRLAASISENERIWELEREKFKLKVRDQYRGVVAEMVMEEEVRSLPIPPSSSTFMIY